MSDVLEMIARREPEITREWGRVLRAQADSSYAGQDEQALLEMIHRSCRALLAVMRSGRTEPMEQELRYKRVWRNPACKWFSGDIKLP